MYYTPLAFHGTDVNEILVSHGFEKIKINHWKLYGVDYTTEEALKHVVGEKYQEILKSMIKK